MRRLVLETAIGPVLPLSDGKDREARWDSAAATGGVTQDPPCSRAARQGPATSEWRSAAEPNVQPGWLVKPLPRRGAWKGLRHPPQNAAESSSADGVHHHRPALAWGIAAGTASSWPAFKAVLRVSNPWAPNQRGPQL